MPLVPRLFRPTAWLVPALILILPATGCDHAKRKEQQIRMVKDLFALQEAAVSGQAIPQLAEAPDAYGKALPFMTFIRGQYQRQYEINQELNTLAKGAEFWMTPREWTSPQVVKEYRAKTERMLALVDEMGTVLHDTIGAPGRARIRALDMPTKFKEGVIKGMEGNAELTRLGQTALETTKELIQARRDILALADTTQVKVVDGVPKFPTVEDAERYRSLVREEQEILGRFRSLLPRLNTESKAALSRSREAAQELLEPQ